jgi:hypothetical protein
MTLSAECSHCRREASLDFEWRSDDAPAAGALWLCPHCNAPNRINVIGSVVGVRKIEGLKTPSGGGE